MLQQTRARTVIPYYEAFLERFPTAQALAAADEEEALRRWSGLGYYQRARNLQRAARRIVEDGGFPRAYEAILDLPGVGAYTAAAVASIAFGAAHAALDGNVMRVVARLTNDDGDIGAPVTRARLEREAARLLDRRDPGGFNQAMMELGATLCLPRQPLCPLCPVSSECIARARGRETQLPVKLRRTEPVRLAVTLLAIERAGRILLWRRQEDARRLGGFWELPSPQDLPRAVAGREIGSFKHCITNHNYTFTLVQAHVSRPNRRFEWFDPPRLETVPLSTTTRKALALLRRQIKSI